LHLVLPLALADDPAGLAQVLLQACRAPDPARLSGQVVPLDSGWRRQAG
jgi:hypothetical protein